MRPILVAGTGSWNDDARLDWYCPGSPFAQFLSQQGLPPAFGRGFGLEVRLAPFVWSTDVGGLPWSRRATWAAAGAALSYFIAVDANVRGWETAVIAHSHGLQPVLYACAEQGIRIAQLISLGSPVRKDMAAIAARARPRIGHWLHLYSDWSDRWQWFGELFDGRLGIVRQHPLADQNDRVPDVGHSQLVRDPALQRIWLQSGWLNPLRESVL